MIKTGGKWDPKAWPVYFIATNPEQLLRSVYDHLLLAVNEIDGESNKRAMATLVNKTGCKLLLDSGVFSFVTKYAKEKNISMDAALTLAPDEMEGFSDLFGLYLEVVGPVRDKVWGYIELDQGGRENKIKTRAKLEALGYRPIPVYHPFNDGWDYFDYLAERYDRICFGNVVNADRVTRKRLVATAWERRRKYPDLWIHLLGMTPNELLTAFPSNSCDSSTWIANLRWALTRTTVALQSFGELDGRGFSYIYNDDRKTVGGWTVSYEKALKMCSYDAFMASRTMRQIAADQKRVLGADIGMFE